MSDDIQNTFKTPEGREKFMAAYEASMALWPTPYETLSVQGRYGTTHVIASGPKNGQPVVLLHGAFASATMWSTIVGELNHTFRTYAVDIIGDPNKSVTRYFPVKPADSAEWLEGVLSALGLERANLVGMSFGAWVAVNFALFSPGRVRRVVAISPAATFTPLGMGFFARSYGMMAVPARPLVKSYVRWFFAHKEQAVTHPLGKQLEAAFLYGKPNLLRPPVLADEELRKLRPPILLLVGEKEVIYRPETAINRARSLVQGLQAEIIPDAGHVATFDQPALVAQKITKYLG